MASALRHRLENLSQDLPQDGQSDCISDCSPKLPLGQMAVAADNLGVEALCSQELTRTQLASQLRDERRAPRSSARSQAGQAIVHAVGPRRGSGNVHSDVLGPHVQALLLPFCFRHGQVALSCGRQLVSGCCSRLAGPENALQAGAGTWLWEAELPLELALCDAHDEEARPVLLGCDNRQSEIPLSQMYFMGCIPKLLDCCLSPKKCTANQIVHSSCGTPWNLEFKTLNCTW